MKLFNRKGIFFSVAGFILHTGIVLASETPLQELELWQQKYPGRPLIYITKNLDVTINLVNNSLETSLDYYREMMVLSDNSAYLADSREYYNNHYTVKKLEAYSLVPDLKQYRKQAVTNFTKTVEIDDYVFYDDQLVYHYAFPSVGKGTKLITRSFAVTSYAYVPIVFDFGTIIPSANMRITLSFPKSVSLNYHLFGSDTAMITFSKNIRGDRITYTWEACNTKAYVNDDQSPDSKYYMPHLIIQIAGYESGGERKSVLGNIKDIYAYCYSHISSLSTEIDPEVKSLADSVTQNCSVEREKVRSIFKWVQTHIKYVAIEDGDNGLVPSEASLVLKRRYGDCKGKTSLLVAMIRSQALKASYAWVGSRERPYRFSEFPSVVCSDHMIAVWWDHDQPVILDGTTYSHRMEDAPAFIQGKECMIEKGKDDYLLYRIPIAPPENNAITDSMSVQLKDNAIEGTGTVTFMGENRALMISRFEGIDTAGYRKVFGNALTKASNKNIIRTVSISDLNNLEQPFVIRYSFVIPDFITKSNNNLYVNIALDRFLQDMIIDEERTIPLESRMTAEYRMYCKFSIPGGYQLKKLPANSSFDDVSFGFSDSYSSSAEDVVLQSRIILNFQVIDGTGLNQFREMMSLINRNNLKSLSFEKTASL